MIFLLEGGEAQGFEQLILQCDGCAESLGVLSWVVFVDVDIDQR
jgi:hypothetical protein